MHGSGFREAAPGDDTEALDDGVEAFVPARPQGSIYGAFDGPEEDDADEAMEPEQFCTNCTGTLVGELCLVRPPPPPPPPRVHARAL